MTKRAVLVGINAYPTSPLKGCVNDVSAMFDLLTQAPFSFPPDNVRVLVDARATTAAIKERLEWLVAGLVPGDTAVFHYSGHGSQVRDRDGDELADHMDEILCPVDLDWVTKVVTDDDLAGYLKRVPAGANCYVILDSCHSGTGTRDLRPPGEDSGNPHKEHYRASRYLPPPFDIEARALGRTLPRQRLGRGALADGTRYVRRAYIRPASWWQFWRWGYRPQPAKPQPPKTAIVVPGLGHALVSGCRSDQTSADAFIEGRYTGAMTYNLVKAVRGNTGKPLQEVHAAARLAIVSGGFTQESQLEGPADLLGKTIFS